MICPLCGKENTNVAEKCVHCGYELDKAFTRRVIEPNMTILRSIQKENEQIEADTEPQIFDDYDAKYCRVYDIAMDSVEEEIEEKSADYAGQVRRDVIECTIAAALFGAAIYVFIHYMVNDPRGDMFNITGMGILGAIGAIAAILSIGFEGSFPVPIKVIFGCSAILVFAIEFPIFTPILLLLYGVCIYYLLIGYGGRLPGVVLGTVAVICLPFWGVILLALIEMMFGGGSRRSNSSRKNKK